VAQTNNGALLNRANAVFPIAMSPASWPTLLSVARLAAAPIVAGLIFWANASAFTQGAAYTALLYAIAAALFIVAALTDALDGWLARRYGAATALGAALDHAADKALVTAALVALAYTLLSAPLAIAAVILLVRDVAVAGLREGFANSGRALPVSEWGKAKTIAEMTAVAALLLSPAAGLAGEFWLRALTWLAHLSIWTAVALALLSAGLYLRAALARPG
jgi:CDP-diacylglycerol--glycerol-3-phosphate 3-phosphatidyltransferase